MPTLTKAWPQILLLFPAVQRNTLVSGLGVQVLGSRRIAEWVNLGKRGDEVCDH